jgi:hypothetical protein
MPLSAAMPAILKIGFAGGKKFEIEEADAKSR